MWIFLLITTVSINPPTYEFNTLATTKTMTECIRMLENYPKNDIKSNQQIYCINAK
jgi:hypothetical protein